MKTLSLLVLSWFGASACGATGTKDPGAEPASPVMSVVPLQFAAADEVASELRQLRPDARIVADGRTNSVLLMCATEADLRQLTDCLAKLDVRVEPAH